MKRPHKSFVVEYKGGSRRPINKTASIWGNLDLKSISQDVEKEQHPHTELPIGQQPSATEAKVNAAERSELSGERQTSLSPIGDPALAPSAELRANAEIEKSPYVEKSEKLRTARTAFPAAILAKKEAKTDVSETNGFKSAKAAKRFRDRQPKPFESEPNTGLLRSRTVKIGAAPEVTEAEYDRAVLRKLEEENKSLRKLLADMLRAENADLRRRLG